MRTLEAERSGNVPLYIRIAEDINTKIEDGEYRVGDALPTFTELAETYDTSIVTINRVMDELGARNLIIRKRGKGVYVAPAGQRSQRSHDIGLYIPDISSSYYASLAKTIQVELIQSNYSTIILSSYGEGTKPNRCLRAFLERRVDGVIVVPIGLEGVEQETILWKLKISRMPFLYLDLDYPRVPSDRVIIDLDKGMSHLAKHLKMLGHKRVSFVASQPFFPIQRRQIEALSRMLSHEGLELRDEHIIVSEKLHDEGGVEAVSRLLETERRPTAIFASDLMTAAGALRSLSEAGLKVPEDMSVASIGLPDTSRLLSIPVTTLVPPTKSMAAAVAEVLINRIEGRLPEDFEDVIVEPELLIQQSTGRVSSR